MGKDFEPGLEKVAGQVIDPAGNEVLVSPVLVYYICWGRMDCNEPGFGEELLLEIACQLCLSIIGLGCGVWEFGEPVALHPLQMTAWFCRP